MFPLKASTGNPHLTGILSQGCLQTQAVHEFRASKATSAHIKFIVLLLARHVQNAPILWVSSFPSIYPPGLAWLGLDPSLCLFARAKDDTESLSTMEVAMRGGMTSVAEANQLSRVAARRLALAAKQGNSLGFLLRHAPAFTPTDSTAFVTRWMISPVISSDFGVPRLKAELLYAKGSRPGMFFFEVHKEADHDRTAHALTLVAGRHETENRFRHAG